MRSEVGLDRAKTSQPGLVPGVEADNRHAADITVGPRRGFDLQTVAAALVKLALGGDVDLFLIRLDGDRLDGVRRRRQTGGRSGGDGASERTDPPA